MVPSGGDHVESAVTVDVTDGRSAEEPVGLDALESGPFGRVEQHGPATREPPHLRGGRLGVGGEDVEHAVAVEIDEQGRRLHRPGPRVEVADDLRGVVGEDLDPAVHPADDDLGRAVAGDVADRR